MIKKLLIGLVLLLIYLNRAYAYFYDFIGQKDLQPPPHSQELVINQSKRQTVKYAALGDSLTAGVGTENYANSLPVLLARKLSQTENVDLNNFAHKGDTSADLLKNQLPQAVAERADVVTVWIGVNDLHNRVSLEDFRKNLRQSLEALYYSNKQIKIYLLTLPSLGSDKIVLPPYNLVLALRTRQYNWVIESIAGQVANTHIIDLSGVNIIYSPDQFHPSDQGYLELSKKINF